MPFFCRSGCHNCLKLVHFLSIVCVFMAKEEIIFQGKGLFEFLHGRSGKVITTSRGVATPTKPMPPLTLQGRETGSIRTVS